MRFEGICLITNDVRRLSEFYQKVLRTSSDCDDNIHQEIKTEGDVDSEFVRLKEMGIKIIDKPTMRPWGAKNMRFCDPDGNFIVFRSFPTEA